MKKYIIKRLLNIIPLLIGITIITFVVMRFAPGGPVETATEMNQKVSAESKQRLSELYGLDKPLHIQYFNWIKRVLVLDFGNSFRDGRPVMKKIAERLPATLALNVLSMLMIFGIAIPIGVISAAKKNSFIDKGLTVFVFIGFSMPTFWLALIMMVIFGIKLGILPISGLTSMNFEELSLIAKMLDVSKHLILPAFVAAFVSLAGLSRYTRSSVLEVIHQDFVKTARAKGLKESTVLFKHVLRNALIPVVTIIGLSLPELIGGSFIFETIFAYPGMGRLGFEAILARDYPTVMGIGTTAAILTLTGNLISDILYAYVDPRIRYR